ncbi:hypothetical protein SDC9_36087 [bioreactor metagenome]|uniref:Uncharacterized protein n=1 Tax=bioreactor metagenome TaxID=1076179 RepID=A0A644VH94_9ZZZZ
MAVGRGRGGVESARRSRCGQGRGPECERPRRGGRGRAGAGGSVPGMTRRVGTVQIPVADMEELPAHRVVQGMHPRIAPVPVEPVHRQRRTRAGQFEQPVRGLERDLRGQHLGLGGADRRLGDGVERGLGIAAVDGAPGDLEQRLGRVQADLQIADRLDRVGVFARGLLAAVDPGPALRLHEADRLVDRRSRDAGVDRRLDDLRDRALHRGMFGRVAQPDRAAARDADVVEPHRARGGGALAESRPVVGDAQPRRIAVGKDQIDPVGPDRDDRHQMGEQGAGGIELLAIHHGLAALEGDAGAELAHRFRAEFGKGIAEAQPGQRPAEDHGLLLLGAVEVDQIDDGDMVLRDLRHRRIAGRDGRDHLGQRRMRQPRPAVCLRHQDGPQPALRIAVEFGERQQPLAVTQLGALREVFRQGRGNGDGVGIVAQPVRRFGRTRARRDRVGRVHARMQAVVDLAPCQRSHRVSFLVVARRSQARGFLARH